MGVGGSAGRGRLIAVVWNVRILQPTAPRYERREAVVTALNESSGLCRTRGGRESEFTGEKTSSALKKECNYKHAAAVSRGGGLRAGLLSLQGLSDARRTSSNLDGLRETP
ncbi:Hypothetical predicted protein [Xyrichtys novacula]|uniref:Uncharacterized protein n=1 Tax=Xyrichtys novacula TaxID=13765 RepID=A0AAV1GIU5_XYRNO|nr:Hypothetical predicted protein [Xyrichtys novacula]